MALRLKKGIKFSFASSFFLIALLIFYISISLISSSLKNKFSEVQHSITTFLTCEQSSKTIRDITNQLTEQAQLFIMTHDEKYALAYINEKFNKKNRENAIENFLKETSSTDANYLKLKIAMNQSDSLSDIELYVIRLAYNAAGIKKIPSEILKINILAKDKTSNMTKQQEIAESIIYGESYLLYKKRVNENCEGIINDIKTNIQKTLTQNSVNTEKLMELLSFLQIITIAISIIFFYIILSHIILPLNKLTKALTKKERMPIIGSRELRFLASTYNEIHEYDALTRSLTRRAFNELCNKFSTESNCNLALILIDIDNFKSINDNYGHSKGDVVLKGVAKFLNNHFRKTDFVSRIGGDEFAIIIPDIELNELDRFPTIIDDINKKLLTFDKELKISISAGIAFSKAGYSQELFENADTALYNAKQHGKSKAYINPKIL